MSTRHIHFAKASENVNPLTGEVTPFDAPLCDFGRSSSTRYRVTRKSGRVTCPACKKKMPQ